MAVVTTTLRSSGGDYTSFVTWESTEQTNLVTDGDSHVLECEGNWTHTASRLDQWAGWTTDATHDVTIKAESGGEHEGVRRVDGGTGFSLAWNTTGQTFDLGSGYINFIDIEWSHTVGISNSVLIRSGCVATFTRCIGDDAAGNTATIRAFSGCTLNMENCLILGNVRGLEDNSSNAGVINNCTFAGGSAESVDAVAANVVYTNCYADDWGAGTYHASCDYNAAADTTAPGTTTVDSVNTGTAFVDYAGGDYTPAYRGVLSGTGVDLSADFLDDITGATR